MKKLELKFLKALAVIALISVISSCAYIPQLEAVSPNQLTTPGITVYEGNGWRFKVFAIVDSRDVFHGVYKLEEKMNE